MSRTAKSLPARSWAYPRSGILAGLLLTLLGWCACSEPRTLAQEKARAVLEGHSGVISGVAFSPDGKTLASASEAKTAKFEKVLGEVRLWDAATGKKHIALQRSTDPEGFWSVAFSPDGKLLAAGGRGKVFFWETATGNALPPLEVDTGKRKDFVFRIALARDAKYLAAVHANVPGGSMTVWDLAERKRVPVTEADYPYISATEIAFSPDGKALLAIPLNAQHIRYWDVQPVMKDPTGGLSHDDVGGPTERNQPEHFAFTPDGKSLAVYKHNGTIKIWDWTTRTKRTILGPGIACQTLQYTPTGKLLTACSHADGTIEIGDPTVPEVLVTLDGHAERMQCLAFAPDGKLLASGGDDHLVKLWEVPAVKKAPAAVVKPAEAQWKIASIKALGNGNDLQIGLQLKPELQKLNRVRLQKKLEAFQVVDAQGQGAGKLRPLKDERNTSDTEVHLTFEGNWKSLKGLSLAGEFYRQPLLHFGKYPPQPLDGKPVGVADKPPPEKAPPSPWSIARVDRTKLLLYVYCRFRKPPGEKQLPALAGDFLLVNQKGEPAYESIPLVQIVSKGDPKKTVPVGTVILIFEGDWKSLQGLYLEGQGYRQSLASLTIAPRPIGEQPAVHKDK